MTDIGKANIITMMNGSNLFEKFPEAVEYISSLIRKDMETSQENHTSNTVGISLAGDDKNRAKIDCITLRDAIATSSWLAILAAEPDRRISVEMCYSDLKIITGMISIVDIKE